MKRLTQKYQLYTQTERDGRLPALDGARALFVLFVGCYHIWQQSWLTPNISIFGYCTSLDPWLRSGYIWVDAMLLLSGFLLYLPHAEAAENGGKAPSIWQFYKKRLLRIVPSYYLCVLIMLIFVALPGGSYNNPDGTFNAWYMGRDLLAHATFTHTLFRFSYIGSPLNGSLWTLGVEMQFYLIFPLVARLFRKKPALCYAGMLAVAFGYRAWVATLLDTTLYFNQLPAQLDVYANGMALAGIYCAIKRRTKQDGWTRAVYRGADRCLLPDCAPDFRAGGGKRVRSYPPGADEPALSVFDGGRAGHAGIALRSLAVAAIDGQSRYAGTERNLVSVLYVASGVRRAAQALEYSSIRI